MMASSSSSAAQLSPPPARPPPGHRRSRHRTRAATAAPRLQSIPEEDEAPEYSPAPPFCECPPNICSGQCQLLPTNHAKRVLTPTLPLMPRPESLRGRPGGSSQRPIVVSTRVEPCSTGDLDGDNLEQPRLGERGSGFECHMRGSTNAEQSAAGTAATTDVGDCTSTRDVCGDYRPPSWEHPAPPDLDLDAISWSDARPSMEEEDDDDNDEDIGITRERSGYRPQARGRKNTQNIDVDYDAWLDWRVGTEGDDDEDICAKMERRGYRPSLPRWGALNSGSDLIWSCGLAGAEDDDEVDGDEKRINEAAERNSHSHSTRERRDVLQVDPDFDTSSLGHRSVDDNVESGVDNFGERRGYCPPSQEVSILSIDLDF
mmetsp:Transcript_19352/g.51561  ORF Transcript_19352/g.51561 Transcript_19352/m.51561 type:complete len:373 (-) Transcript_19352:17-1135(-)